MKIALPLLFCFLLLPIKVANGNHSDEIPKAVTAMLAKKFPSWRFAGVSSEVQQFFRERLTGASPNSIKGDFDGNGQMDYAVVVEHSDFDKSGKAFCCMVTVLAFLKSGSGFKLHILEESAGPNLELYMTLARKGSAGRNFDTQSKFKYPNDSVSVWYFEKAGGTYIYSKGRFRYVLESD
jgi:hypothetical protein